MAAEMDPGMASRLGASLTLCPHGRPSATYCPECIETARIASEARGRATLMAVAPTGLNPAEAVWGLLAWLTTRDAAVSFGADHDCGVAVELAKQFCETNGLGDCRDGWERHLTHPPGPPTDHEASTVAVPEGQSE